MKYLYTLTFRNKLYVFFKLLCYRFYSRGVIKLQ